VGVDVDETRTKDLPVAVEFVGSRASKLLANKTDLPGLDGKIANERRSTSPIYYGGSSDDRVCQHITPTRRWRCDQVLAQALNAAFIPLHVTCSLQR
jgi:hypothetical protein